MLKILGIPYLTAVPGTIGRAHQNMLDEPQTAVPHSKNLTAVPYSSTIGHDYYDLLDETQTAVPHSSSSSTSQQYDSTSQK